jgi:hypothetical protein
VKINCDLYESKRSLDESCYHLVHAFFSVSSRKTVTHIKRFNTEYANQRVLTFAALFYTDIVLVWTVRLFVFKLLTQGDNIEGLYATVGARGKKRTPLSSETWTSNGHLPSKEREMGRSPNSTSSLRVRKKTASSCETH